MVKILQKRISGKSIISQEFKSIFKQIIEELVKADKLLAEVAIYDAQNSAVQNPKFQELVDRQIAKAQERLVIGTEISDDQPAKAIANFAISWLHAQLAIRFTSLNSKSY